MASKFLVGLVYGQTKSARSLLKIPVSWPIIMTAVKRRHSSMSTTQMPKVVLITGCSSGIGLATAALLAKDPAKRFTVYGTILQPLDQEKEFSETAGDALNDTLFPVHMDVTKDDTVSEAVASVMKNHGQVDILVNNAGILIKKVTETLSMDAIQRLFNINFFGMARVTNEVLPIMKKQQSGRIINVTSRNALEGAPYVGVYSASKFAIEGLSEEMAVIGRFFNIWVSLGQPGGVTTPIVNSMIAANLGGVGSAAIRNDPAVHELDRRLSTYLDHPLEWSKCPAVTSEDVAEVILRAATDERPHFRYQTSEPVTDLARRKYRDASGDEFIDYQVERLRPFFDKSDQSDN